MGAYQGDEGDGVVLLIADGVGRELLGGLLADPHRPGGEFPPAAAQLLPYRSVHLAGN